MVKWPIDVNIVDITAKPHQVVVAHTVHTEPMSTSKLRTKKATGANSVVISVKLHQGVVVPIVLISTTSMSRKSIGAGLKVGPSN